MVRLKQCAVYGLVMQCILLQPAFASTKPFPFLILGGQAEAPRGYLAMCTQIPTECDGNVSASSSASSTDVQTPAGTAIGATGAIVVATHALPAPATPPAPVTVPQSGFPIEAGSPMLASVLHPGPTPPPPTSTALTSPGGDEQLLREINLRVNRIVRQATDLAVYGREEVWHASGAYQGAAGDCEDMALEKKAELIAAGFPKNRLSLAVVYAPAVGLHTVLIARTRDGDQVLDSRTPYLRPWYKAGYSWLSVQAFAGSKAWRQPLSERQIALAATDTGESDQS